MIDLNYFHKKISTSPLVRFNEDLQLWEINISKRFQREARNSRTSLTWAPYDVTNCLFLAALDPKDSQFNTILDAIKSTFLKNKEDYILSINQFDFPTYNLKSPWSSAMSHGLLCLALSKTSQKEHNELKGRLLNSFTSGTFNVSNNEFVYWFEEYPSKHPSFVLNGYIFALFGYFSLAKSVQNKGHQRIALKSFESLNSNLHKFDFYGWSKYCLLKGNLVNHDYQKLQIYQLKLLLDLFPNENNENIKYYYKKWANKYDKTPIVFVQTIRIILGIKNRIYGYLAISKQHT